MRQRELLLRRSKDLCTVGQGGWAACLGLGAGYRDGALHNCLLSQLWHERLAWPIWGQRSMAPGRGDSVCMHCCGSVDV